MITVKGHRLLVKVEKMEDVDKVYASAAKAGLVFADTDDTKRARAGLDKGTVVQVGSDAFKQFYLNCNGTLDGLLPWCVAGDFIAFAKYAGKFITDPEDDKEYIVINDEDVVAVLKGKQDV